MSTVPMLFAKLHRATVTGADLNYEGSIAIDPALLRASGIRPLQRVEVYDIDNGSRLATYALAGKPGEVLLNGAAARLVHPGDRVIICAYGDVAIEQVDAHTATVVLLGEGNKIDKILTQSSYLPFLEFDGKAFKTLKEFHEIMSKKPGFPVYYGKNFDALWDVLTGMLDAPLTIIWKNHEYSQGFTFYDDILNFFKEFEEYEMQFEEDRRIKFVLG